MKALLRNQILVFALVVVTTTNCSQDGRLTTPNENLLNNLQSRFDDNNYVSKFEVPKNPFESDGKKAAKLFNKVRSSVSNYRQVQYQNNGTSKFRFASFNQIREVSQGNDANTFGIESPGELNAVTKILTQEDNSITREAIMKTNDALKEVPLSEVGGLKILDNAVNENRISPLQRDLMVLNYKEMTTAKSKEELISISNTFETEIANSNIDSADKNALLLNCSLVRHMVLENPSIGGIKALNTAVVMPLIVGVLLPAAIIYGSYWVGRGIGAIFCDPSSPSAYEACLDTYGGIAAMLAVAAV